MLIAAFWADTYCILRQRGGFKRLLIHTEASWDESAGLRTFDDYLTQSGRLLPIGFVVRRLIIFAHIPHIVYLAQHIHDA